MSQAVHSHEDKLLEFAYGELPPQEAKAVEAHLQACSRCAEFLEAIGGVRRTMSQLREEPAPDAGLESLLAYAEQSARRAAAGPEPRAWWRRFMAPLAGVAALMVLTVVAWETMKSADQIGRKEITAEPIPPAAVAPSPEPVVAKEEAPRKDQLAAYGDPRPDPGFAQLEDRARKRESKPALAKKKAMERKADDAPRPQAKMAAAVPAEPARDEAAKASERESAAAPMPMMAGKLEGVGSLGSAGAGRGGSRESMGLSLDTGAKSFSSGSAGPPTAAYRSPPSSAPAARNRAAAPSSAPAPEEARAEADSEMPDWRQARVKASASDAYASDRAADKDQEQASTIYRAHQVLNRGARGAERMEALLQLCIGYEELGKPDDGAPFCRALLAEFPRSAAAQQVRARQRSAPAQTAPAEAQPAAPAH